MKVKMLPMWKRSLVLGALGCALTVAASAAAQAPRFQAPERVNGFAWQLLAQHNAERDRKGLQRLAWSHKLAQQAQGWAERLARENRMYHADPATRAGAGENLWYGSIGAFGAQDMVGAFLAERQHYRPGAFPQVSRTGRWQDVGHYTQIIWPGTKEVGCAVARNRAHDYLVCRYWPAGNTVGVRID